MENNTAYLLAKNWRGAWVEGNPKSIAAIRKTFAEQLSSGQLLLWPHMITPAAAESALNNLAIPEEPDLLSLDVDYNTHWVWQAIVNWRPRVVVIEYSTAVWPPA